MPPSLDSLPPAPPDVVGVKLVAALTAGREWGARAQALTAELRAARGDGDAFEALAAKAKEMLAEGEGLGMRATAEAEALQVRALPRATCS